MLVGALQIEVGRPSEIIPVFQHEGVGRAGVEPHIENVGDLLVIRPVGDKAVEKALGRTLGEPRIRPFASNAAMIRAFTAGSRSTSPVSR